MKQSLWTMIFGIAIIPNLSLAGPFGSYVDTGIPASSIAGWATGFDNYIPSAAIDTGFDIPSNVVGPANENFASLGDLTEAQIQAGNAPGTITVSFDNNIFNGPGTDLAVFENAGFYTAPFIFAELAFVEVSSNGSDFARFPATSRNTEGTGNTDTDILDQFRSFAGINTTNVNNLAGIHPQGMGTPFDLEDLTANTLVASGNLDLDAIRYVRLVDIPGNGDFIDSELNGILDAWLTTGSGGFDLDAVGALNIVPEPSSLLLAACFGFAVTLRCRQR